jgi:hypothetical protein
MRGSVVCRLVSTPFRCPKTTIPQLMAAAERMSVARGRSPSGAEIRYSGGRVALASSLTVRHLPLEQGIEGSNPSSPANFYVRNRPPEATPRAF